MRRAAIVICVSLVFLVSCSRTQPPVETSLGKLVRIEKVNRVVTDERAVSPAAGEVLYLLSFEGKKEIAVPPGLELALVDSAGTERLRVYAGSPTREGILTKKQWIYNGSLTGQQGKLVFTGTISLPEPRVTLVYSVPSGAAGWVLKDGERKHPVL
jgi:hypothetical protein